MVVISLIIYGLLGYVLRWKLVVVFFGVYVFFLMVGSGMYPELVRYSVNINSILMQVFGLGIGALIRFSRDKDKSDRIARAAKELAERKKVEEAEKKAKEDKEREEREKNEKIERLKKSGLGGRKGK